MSYILDALRRAEAERDRGAVPSIHAQPLSMPMAGPAPARAAWMPWAVAAIALLLVGVLGWRLLAGRDSAPPVATIAQSTTTPAPALATPQPAPASMPAAVVPATPQPTMPTTVPKAPPAISPSPRVAVPQPRSTEPSMRVARPVDRPAERTGTPPAARADAGDSDGDADTTTTTATVPAAKAGAANHGLIYNRGDLPADVQRQLPNLAIGGATYSQDPASRMVIINGQVFREGDPLGPDLALEKIELKAAVLRFKGYRYRITF